ncbi:delta-class carbonic anhydrase [uncultured Rhodospira sp.]|uniref:delta-class carbonic anhydrase n=1 Tax=uncultured Rhodospira sp. TaxID=1936189 RepID=UPI002612B2F9|nr:delta-class carbonic anhydrase [uncultured Rhodospira sp.]
MSRLNSTSAAVAALIVSLAGPVWAADLCEGFGPQTPRDISERAGSNARVFTLAPAASAMNLCDIHFHVNAEHKGPGYSVFAGDGEHGGYQCNETAELTEAERTDPEGAHGACHGLHAGDTIEVHWVYTSCDVDPGPGLGSCLSDACANPQLRVESQVFLVVNDDSALDFADFTYDSQMMNGLHQAKALPTGTGEPVVFPGSTTGPKYTQAECSPMQVTWSVRPSCAKVNISSVHAWCGNNAFGEDHAHGVRQLVTATELLAPME